MNKIKTFNSPTYNYIFNRDTGLFIRWGNTVDDDPEFSPYGPEIVDIEVTTQCHGPDGKVCKFCYKANTPKGKNMSFDTFKRIFDKLPPTVTQIAFGADATLTSNRDIWRMFEYCNENNVVPNVTVANVDVLTAYRLSQLCGGVAVSRYEDRDLCYDSVCRLTTFGLRQVNIHQMLSEQTFDQAMETLDDLKRDYRLKDVRAIIFLSLKQKGRGKTFDRLSTEKFKMLIDKANDLGISYGFDSCSANKFVRAMNTQQTHTVALSSIEPCESACFSMYINVDGEYFPCSFSEHQKFDAGDWTSGLNVAQAIDFVDDIWDNKKQTNFVELY